MHWNGRAEEGEGQQESQPAHGAAVWVVTFLGQTGCESLVERGGLIGQAT